MPVTAKLSRKFYETFGEDVTNELVEWLNSVDTTYRADLRELNELNFSRFRAELAAEAARLRGDLSREIGRSESALIRWMFAFWAPTALAVAALLLRR